MMAPHPFWREHPLAHLRPAILEDRVQRLIQDYRSAPDPRLAGTIAALYRLLCLHPDFHTDAVTWCHYRHQVLYWQCLARREQARCDFKARINTS
ncbi:hypothetical protein MIT9_P0880 [Methylomarinovum caldicuralii]|uniref:Uncharacterized protein n=1 Tax=Methylomarinovum caldicuralii TaxID=438856 RepID=A0AAU9BYY8_9GAMM|nr:hypothetical protein [Methylomarinovum caldicuralii]BCX81302.1 hypothetical protein MIT9_P0880 [Methylomarinovum caldicuralii]